MTLPLTMYAKIKDRYCVGYFGDRDDVILKLRQARPVIERELPGIHVYICCNDEKKPLLEGEDKCFYRSELEAKKPEIVYFRELDKDAPDPVGSLLEESNIPFSP